MIFFLESQNLKFSNETEDFNFKYIADDVENIVPMTLSYYQTENGNDGLIASISHGIGIFFIQGIIITMLTLGIFEIIKRKKTGYNTL